MLKKFTNLKKTAERLVVANTTPEGLRIYYQRIISAIKDSELEEIFIANGIKHIGPCVEVKSLEELTETRAQFRSVFGSWSDKLSSVFHYIGTTMIARYKSEDNEAYIDLLFDVSDVPEGLLEDTCRIEKRSNTYTNTTENYTVVCKED